MPRLPGPGEDCVLVEDLRAMDSEALEHFLRIGQSRGFNTSPDELWFCTLCVAWFHLDEVCVRFDLPDLTKPDVESGSGGNAWPVCQTCGIAGWDMIHPAPRPP
jgi:hypothetical protein